MGAESNPHTIGSCPLDTVPTPPPSVPPVTIRCSVYFDGTGNNRENTASRIANATHYRILRAIPDDDFLVGSYNNDNTNVEKLDRYSSGANSMDHFVHIYVQGIGTTAGVGDDPIGSASGALASGVVARVNNAFEAVMREVRSRVSNPDSPVRIYIDAFGFSRGAAAARYFAYQVMEHENIFSNPDGQSLQVQLREGSSPLNIVAVQIKFMGLFDTVAAYGISHETDEAQLHLTAITHAERVVHLAAANEHRLNFPLVNIQSKGGGVEIFLPGVHSDIGGGYTNTDAESDLIVYELDNDTTTLYPRALLNEINRLVSGGWYRGLELVMGLHDIKATRGPISKEYSFIPLHIMYRYAHQSGLIYNTTNLNSENVVPADLNTLKTRIDSYVSSHEGGGSQPSDWNTNDPVINEARHGYFHSSAYYSRTDSMRPQFCSAAGVYQDNMLIRVTGERRRRIFNG